MINFRFHIVSLIAVFLALTIGIVMGSTVIDKVTVDQLQRRLNQVEVKDDEVRSTNDALRKQVTALQGFIDQSSPLLSSRRLAGFTVAAIAVRGADGTAVRAAVDTLRAAGAKVPAVVWLEPAWALTDRGAADKLSTALALPPTFTTAPSTGSTTTTRPGKETPTTASPAIDTLRRQALRDLALRLVKPSRSGIDVLASLQASGFVAIDGEGESPPDLAAFPPPSTRIVVIGGDDGRRISPVVAGPLVATLSEVGATVAFAEVYRELKGVFRGDVVDDVRHNQALAARVPTVDNLDTVQGRVTLVLTLDELARGVVGHYGTGRGAKRQVPQPAAVP